MWKAARIETPANIDFRRIQSVTIWSVKSENIQQHQKRFPRGAPQQKTQLWRRNRPHFATVLCVHQLVSEFKNAAISFKSARHYFPTRRRFYIIVAAIFRLIESEPSAGDEHTQCCLRCYRQTHVRLGFLQNVN
jgi:hypothetical protein